METPSLEEFKSHVDVTLGMTFTGGLGNAEGMVVLDDFSGLFQH